MNDDAGPILSEHVVPEARTGPIRRRGWTWVALFVCLALSAIVVDVLAVLAIQPESAWYRTPFLLVIAPLYLWFAVKTAVAVRRMRGDYVVRRYDDRVEASWGGRPWGTVHLARNQAVSIRKNWLGDPVLHSVGSKVSLFPELSGHAALLATLAIPDRGVPLTATASWVGTDDPIAVEPPPGTTDGEFEALERWERRCGLVGLAGTVVMFVSALLFNAGHGDIAEATATLGDALWAIVFVGSIAAALGGGGLAMHLRGRYIRKHRAYRFGLIGDILERGPMASFTGLTLEVLGALLALGGLFAGVLAAIIALGALVGAFI
jgi:hypothetical protein